MKNEKLRSMAIVFTTATTFLVGGYQYGIAAQQQTIDEQQVKIESAEQEIVEHKEKISTLENTVSEKEQQIQEITKQKEEAENPIANLGEPMTFEATAYTDGGNTASGFNLSGHSWESARVIAVDPRVIPLGAQVYVEFDGAWSQYSGVYTASDTGGAINGHIIDVFVGHGQDSLAYQFGRRNVRVYRM